MADEAALADADDVDAADRATYEADEAALDDADAFAHAAWRTSQQRLIAPDEELVAGRRPVEEAFAARREAHRLLVVPERRAALDALVLHATTLRIPVVELEGGSLTSLAGFDGHQGVALVVAERRWATLDEILARARSRGEAPLVLVLDSLEDPQNVGTLLRSAEASGVHGVLFPTRRQAPMTASAIKASAGASEHLLLAPVDDLPGTLVDLHARGLRMVGSDEDAPMSYREADLRGPLALVVGSEGRGVSGAVRRRLDLVVRIPMRGKVASLNAAVAGSVLLFEASAQRPMPTASVAEAPATAKHSEAPAELGPAANAEVQPASQAPKPKRRAAVAAPKANAKPHGPKARARKAAASEATAGEASSPGTTGEDAAATPAKPRTRAAAKKALAEPAKPTAKARTRAAKPLDSGPSATDQQPKSARRSRSWKTTADPAAEPTKSPGRGRAAKVADRAPGVESSDEQLLPGEPTKPRARRRRTTD